MSLSNTQLYRAIRTGLAVGTVGVVGFTGTAIAQDDSDQRTLDRIEVIGSRIKRVEAETAQPIFRLTSEDIQATGLTSIGDVIQNLTTNGSALGTTFNNGGDGSSRVSLRNLGTGRTLVLVNGRRFISVGTGGAIDLNSIPSAAVESISVLKDGASAIYGSDAVAGVVDIRLKRNYSGAEVNAQWGEWTEGDGRRQKYDFVIGFDGERGSATVGAGYVKEDPIMAGDRAISAVPLYGFPATDTSYAGASGVGPRLRVFTATQSNLILEHGADGTSASQWRPFSAALDGHNFAPENYLQTPQERTSFFFDGRYSVLDNVSFYTTMVYNERRSNQVLASFPLTGGILTPTASFRPAVISADNIYNPFGVDITGWGRRVMETGGRDFEQRVDNYTFNGGFEGDFSLGDRFFFWDVGYTFGQSQRNDATAGLQNALAVRNAVGPSFYDANGVARCGTPTAVVAGCVPLNLFGPLGAITPEMLNYIGFTEQGRRGNKMTNYYANLSGDLFEIVEGNPVAFAAGYEYRRESAYDSPDAFVNAGLSSGNARTPTRGGFNLDEFYVELNIPVLGDLPLVDLLELRLAGRYSDYSNFGDTTNLSAGFKWQPFADLALRGNWSEGFRAPSVGQLFQGPFDSFAPVADPCSAQRIPNLEQGYPGLEARCRAGGAPVGYTQVGSQIRSTGGSNPDLDPETTTSQTLGFVYSPGWFEGFGVTLDWYKIDIDQGMLTLTPNFILNQCYIGPTEAVRSFYCSLVDRRASDGVVTDIRFSPQNVSNILVEGYDLNVSYAFDSDWGRFGVLWDSTYTSKYEVTLAGTTTQRVGRELGDDAYNRLRSNLNLSWNLGDWGVNWAMRYYHHTVEDCEGLQYAEEDLGIAQPCSDPNRSVFDPIFGEDVSAARNKQGSTTIHDVRFTWNTPWNGQIGLGVNNVFEKDPPISYNSFANTFNAAVWDAPGRQWFVQYNQRF